jgi:hypothetical protein
MKNRHLTTGLVVYIIASTSAAWAADQPASTNAVAGTNGLGPKIQFASTAYDFGHVISGTLVKHDFVFTNTGDAMLEITGVTPGCGCTTVGDWTHTVEPGKTGVIPIQFNSSGYNQPVVKTPSLTCNDKSQPRITLQLHGTVQRAVEFSQQFVSFVIGPDSNGETNAVIHITNNEDQPITLSAPFSSLRCFAAEVKTNTPGKRFDLIIKTVPPLDPGNNQAVISLQSSSTNTETINVIAMANAQTPFIIRPEQITIPTSPLTSNVTATVFIRNQSSHSVVLSDPSVNTQGVDAKINASEPGRMYSVTLNFPEKFQGPPGLPLVLETKTDHPWLRDLKVPITQTPAPASAPAK